MKHETFTRARIAERWLTARAAALRAGETQTRAMRRFLRTVPKRRRPSPSTLKRWIVKYQRCGPAALSERRGRPAKMHAAARALLASVWISERPASLRAACDAARAAWADFPEYRTVLAALRGKRLCPAGFVPVPVRGSSLWTCGAFAELLRSAGLLMERPGCLSNSQLVWEGEERAVRTLLQRYVSGTAGAGKAPRRESAVSSSKAKHRRCGH